MVQGCAHRAGTTCSFENDTTQDIFVFPGSDLGNFLVIPSLEFCLVANGHVIEILHVCGPPRLSNTTTATTLKDKLKTYALILAKCSSSWPILLHYPRHKYSPSAWKLYSTLGNPWEFQVTCPGSYSMVRISSANKHSCITREGTGKLVGVCQILHLKVLSSASFPYLLFDKPPQGQWAL